METIHSLSARLTGMVESAPGRPLVERPVRACNLVDYETATASSVDRSDEVVLLLVDGPAQLATALRALAASDPALVLAKAPDVDTLAALADDAGIANVMRVGASLSWGALYVMVDRLIMSGSPVGTDDAHGMRLPRSDLFAIATSLAPQVGGYVSIDDSHSRVLAFSPLDADADSLRRDSILGRGAPAGHREELRAEGVWERLKQPGRVVELPASGERRARMAAGIIDERTGMYLGTVWVQEGVGGFTRPAREYIAAAARLAAQIILRADYVETRAADAQLQLLGLRYSQDPISTVAGFAGIGGARAYSLVAFDCPRPPGEEHTSFAALIGLHVMSLSSAAKVTAFGDRVYVVVPEPPAPAVIDRWARHTLSALSATTALARGATGPIVGGIEELHEAREVVDVLLDRLIVEGETEVAVYQTRQAQFAMARILRTLTEQRLVGHERVDAILATSYVDGEQLLHTIKEFLRDDRRHSVTAARLHIHPNTLRQRVRRVERLTGLSLSDPDERLLLELELRAHEVARAGLPSAAERAVAG